MTEYAVYYGNGETAIGCSWYKSEMAAKKFLEKMKGAGYDGHIEVFE